MKIRIWTFILCAMSSAAFSQTLTPLRLEVDPAGNGVLEPGEGPDVVPVWENPSGPGGPGGSGVLSNFVGPVGPAYTIADPSATYPAWGTGPVTVSCNPSNCYALRVTATSRPVSHWDATVTETLFGGAFVNDWRVHVGETFTDVPATNGFYRFIEAIVHKNVTGGCTTDGYCPAAPTTRGAMAVFLLVAHEAPGYTPIPCSGTPTFDDVPTAHPLCPWVEELARRGITSGCDGTHYCPNAPVSREAMAVFVLSTRFPGVIPPACTSDPYHDVPESSPYCRWILDLTNRGYVSGCGNNNYCPTADVTREQMSVFLATVFDLLNYLYT